MIKLISLFILFCLAGAALAAQEIIYERYQDQVDFWVILPYNMVLFKKGQDTVQYQISVEIKNARGKQVEKHEEKLVIPRREWLQDTALPVFFQAELPPGKYTASLRIRNLVLGDKRNLKKAFTLQDSFTEIGQPYYLIQKEEIRFLPSGVGAYDQPIQSCQISQRFSNSVDSIHVYVDDAVLRFIQPQSPFRLELADRMGDAPPQRIIISFFEGNIRYNMEPFLYSQWFSFDLRYTLKEQIQQLRYIASQNEWQTLRALPEGRYAEAIEKFWQVHDPSPGTIRNEARERFYQRIIIADERYTIHKKLKGWASDRGRIYIKYGEPDEILSEVHPIGLYPYISWIYYKLNLEFIFADIGGYGQYVLRNKDEEY